jgi:hypothetical protein
MTVQPVHTGGHWQIVNVDWGAGVYVLVTVVANYETGALGSRTVDVTLTQGGKDAGGKIIGHKIFHVPEVTDGDDPHPPYSKFVAVLRFTRAPKGTGPAYFLTLDGAITVVDTSNPTPREEPFCGTTTVTITHTRFLTHFGGPEQTQVWQTDTWTTTTPAGTGTFVNTFQLADVTADDVNNAPPAITTTSTSIWYVDAFGNYIDTHRPCDELPPPGGPPASSTHTEGFNSIETYVYPTKGYGVLAQAAWEASTPLDEIVFKKNAGAVDGFLWASIVPRPQVGLNSDHLPIYDDLPNGTYDFRLTKLLFDHLPPQKPPQKFNVLGTYPLSPVIAKYFFAVATAKPYLIHRTIPADLLLWPGNAPPADQLFD